MKLSIACSCGTRLRHLQLCLSAASSVANRTQRPRSTRFPGAAQIFEQFSGRWQDPLSAPKVAAPIFEAGYDGDHRRVSLRRGSIHDRGRLAARGAPVLVSRLPVSRRGKRDGQRDLQQGGADSLRAADRLCEPGRQRLDHAPPVLRPMRHAGTQSGRAAPASDHRPRRDPRRSKPGEAWRDHLDKVGSKLGLLRSGFTPDRGPAAAPTKVEVYQR